MLKIGVISLAHMHGYSYASALQQLPDVEFVGIADEDSERGKKGAEQFGVQFFERLEDLLLAVDGVIVCSPNALHAKYTIAAAKAKNHILCEKPLALSSQEGVEMVKAAEDNEVILQTAFPMRFSTPVMRVKELVDSGEIGEIVAISGTNHGKMPPGWFLDKSQSGGGAVFDHTVHVVDLMRWIMRSEVKDIYAEVDTLLHDVDIDDAGMLTMTFENGVIATLDPSWSRPESFPIWGDVTMQIIGTKGIVSLDAFAQAGEIHSDITGNHELFGWGDNSDSALVSSFIDAIRGKETQGATGIDGLRAAEVALAAYESAKRVAPVTLDVIRGS